MTGNPPRWIASRLDRLSRLSRRNRRIIAVATLLGLPCAHAWSSFWLTTSMPNILWGPVTFVLFGATIWGAVLLYGFVRNRADMPGAGLDERQRLMRDQAWILGYRVLSAVILLATIAVGITVLGFGHAVTLDATTTTAIVLSVTVLIPVLPAATLAWIEPDPVEES
jgi:hypothetical protein